MRPVVSRAVSRAVPRREVLALLGTTALAVSCGSTAGGGGGSVTTLRYQGWAGTVTPAELAADLGFLRPVRLEWVGNTTSGPQDIQSVASGQIDFGGAFNGAVVKLVAAKAPIKAVISYYGCDRDAYNGFYALARGPIRSARDLIGAKVGMNTLGAHAEAVLDLHLQREGLSEAEIATVERLVLPPVSTEQALRQRQVDVAVLGGVLRDAARERGGVRELFTDRQLLRDSGAGTYVVSERLLERAPDTVRAFVTGVAKALEWSRVTPREQVVARMVAIVTRRKRQEDVTALRHWRSYGVTRTGGRIEADEFSVWADWLADRGDIRPGQVALSELYTNAFNTYRVRKGAERESRADR